MAMAQRPENRPEVTVVGFGPDANQKYVTTYFRRQFTLQNAADISGLALDLLRDDGAIIYLNGTEIFRDSMPVDPIAFDTLALAPADEAVRVTASLDAAKAALLVNGVNTLAVEIHQAARNSPDISFDLRMTALRQRHGVNSNDIDRDPLDPIAVSQVVGPQHGNLTLNPNGSFVYTPTGGYSGPDSFTYKVNDGTADSNIATANITVGNVAPSSTVVGRKIFYNRSKFDGNDAAAGAADDAAISPKTARLPTGTATSANYTNYSRGINGIMVDITNLPAGTPQASDFIFKVGNDNTPSGWSSLRIQRSRAPRGRYDGSDRVTFIWNDGDIKKQWLQVTTKVTAATGLTAADVFYFGNAIGEIENTTANAFVNATDETTIRANPKTFTSPALVGDQYDINRDGFVNATDQIIVRSNTTKSTNALLLIVPSSAFSAAASAEPVSAEAIGVSLSDAAISSSQPAVSPSTAAPAAVAAGTASGSAVRSETAPLSRFALSSFIGPRHTHSGSDASIKAEIDAELLDLLAGSIKK